MNKKTDRELVGNYSIEKAIHDFKERSTDETLARLLTVIRRRVKEHGHFVIAVDFVMSGMPLTIRPVETGDGSQWWAAFTSYEEELKGNGSSQPVSLFTADMEQIFDQVMNVPEIKGILVNPWGESIPLDKQLIEVIMQYRTATPEQ